MECEIVQYDGSVDVHCHEGEFTAIISISVAPDKKYDVLVGCGDYVEVRRVSTLKDISGVIHDINDAVHLTRLGTERVLNRAISFIAEHNLA